MRKEGFLPTFPIVFRRLDLPYFDDFTSELYIVRVWCASNNGCPEPEIG